MAINENIVTGRKFRRLINKDSKLWQRISWWTKSSDVEFDDGKTAEQKLGNINGITSDFSVDNESIAASSNLTKRAYERFNEFTDGGRIKGIIIGEDGKPYIEYWNEDGADTVLKKLGEIESGMELTYKVRLGHNDTGASSATFPIIGTPNSIKISMNQCNYASYSTWTISLLDNTGNVVSKLTTSQASGTKTKEFSGAEIKDVVSCHCKGLNGWNFMCNGTITCCY